MTTRRNPLAAAAEPLALASEAPQPSNVSRLEPGKIRTNGGTQMRATLNEETVSEYLEAITGWNSWPFPPVVVFYDGSDHWLGDGFHRVEAANRYAARERITYSVLAEVRPGTRRDAVLCAAGANAVHGLRRTNADKRRAVEALLRDGEWGKWGDREIARRCHVSAPLVAQLRSEIHTANSYSMNDEPSPQAPTERTYVHPKTGQQTTMNTTGQREAAQQRHKPAQPPPVGSIRPYGDEFMASYQDARGSRIQANFPTEAEAEAWLQRKAGPAPQPAPETFKADPADPDSMDVRKMSFMGVLPKAAQPAETRHEWLDRQERAMAAEVDALLAAQPAELGPYTQAEMEAIIYGVLNRLPTQRAEKMIAWLDEHQTDDHYAHVTRRDREINANLWWHAYRKVRAELEQRIAVARRQVDEWKAAAAAPTEARTEFRDIVARQLNDQVAQILAPAQPTPPAQPASGASIPAACPACHGEKWRNCRHLSNETWSIECQSCGHIGPSGESIARATELWNKQAEEVMRAAAAPDPAPEFIPPAAAFAESYIQREPTEAEQRRKRVQELIDLWRAALNSLPECGELTGHFSHDPVRRAVAPILEALEANL